MTGKVTPAKCYPKRADFITSLSTPEDTEALGKQLGLADNTLKTWFSFWRANTAWPGEDD